MDPENKTVTYQITGNPHKGLSITKDGKLTYQSQKLDQFKITIRATDMCGAYTDQEFTIEPLRCPCGGRCRWKESDNDGSSPEMECVCPEGCTGEKCNESIPGKSCNTLNVEFFWLYLYSFWSYAEEMGVDHNVATACCVVGVVVCLLLVCCKQKKKEKHQ